MFVCIGYITSYDTQKLKNTCTVIVFMSERNWKARGEC